MNKELLDDYTKADFPLDLPWNYGRVRLLAAFGDRVVGAVCTVSKAEDGSEVLTFQQSLSWSGDGKYDNGNHPTMDLPPPAAVANRVHELREEKARCQERLDAMPDAPVEWRSADKRRIASITRDLAQLTGETA